jgi:hypothetical protein
LEQLRLAIEMLYHDTGLHPAGLSIEPCYQNPEVLLNECDAGIVYATQKKFPAGWNGPYMPSVPLDPWGMNYMFDADYDCGGATIGCPPDSVSYVRAVLSFGPNKAQNCGDGDDIVLVLCRQ